MALRRTAEEARLRYQYRTLILRGKVRLSLQTAQKLVGPDCAYHLYSSGYEEPKAPTKRQAEQRKK